MRSNRWMSVAALTVAAGLLAACGDDDGGDADRAAQNTTTIPGPAAPVVAADMVAADGSPAGRVTFTETGGRLTVEARLTNLPPGFHGFHVHAVGKCERGNPAFMSAGGHMVIGDQAHPVHAGDQPVLLVLADRTAELRFTTDRYKLSDLQLPEGRAVIVHANADNYANVPTRYVREPDATTKSTGDAGDRIACGVVGGSSGVIDASTTTTAAVGGPSTTRAGGRPRRRRRGRRARWTARPSPSRPTARMRPAASRPPACRAPRPRRSCAWRGRGPAPAGRRR